MKVVLHKRLLATVSAVTLAACTFSQAQAADLGGTYKPAQVEPMRSMSWDGWYGGGHVGYGWGELTQSGSECSPSSGVAAQACSGTDDDGWFGGAQFGINFQGAGNWVGGLEVDVSGADIDGKHLGGGSSTLTTFADDIDLMGSVRGRFGYTFNSRPVLVYGTGGLAFVHLDITEIGSSSSEVVASNSHFGWIIGAGAEWRLRKNHSIALQYTYSDFMKEMTHGFSGDADPYDFELHQVSMRYNIHIN